MTGSWLSGGVGEPGGADQEWPGEHLGLPREGPGAVAGRGARFGALLVDFVLTTLATSLFVRFDANDTAQMQQFNYIALVVWFVLTVVMIGLFGFTPGKLLFGLRAVRVDGSSMVNLLRAIPRTLLTALVVPAALADADGRGLHDKLTGTVVVRTR